MRDGSADLVVMGGGPAGLACAMAARREGLSALVVERSDMTEGRVGEHVPPSALPAFRALGIADLLGSERHRLCPGVRSAWGSAEAADKDYLFDAHGMGTILTRPDFDREVAERARSLGVMLRTGSRVTDVSRSDAGWRLSVDGQAVRAGFLVDATGRAASLAKRLGSRRLVFDRLVALVGRSPPGQGGAATICIEAVENGWWYSAGTRDGSVIAMYLTDRDCIATARGDREAAWRLALAAAPLTRGRCPALRDPRNLRARAACTGRLSASSGDGWLAVGDASYSLDPLSSEGISKGVAEAPAAARAAADYCRGERDGLSRYRRGVERAFAEQLLLRYRFYRAERRWPRSPFWSRRHVAPAPLPPQRVTR